MMITDRQKFTFTSGNDIKAISDALNFIDTDRHRDRKIQHTCA